VQYQKPIITQQQKLKMNPQLYQSIRLMAMPIQELRFRIQEELERNPALEIIEERSELSLDEETASRSEEYDYFENSSDPGYTGRRGEEASESKRQFIEGALSRSESLQEHLLWQLRLQPIPEVWFEIGEMLIRNLDANGFHLEDPFSLAKVEHREILIKMMDLVRGFEPVGTCTTDYIESLIVQTEKAPDAPERTKELLENHLTLLEKGKHEEIMHKMHISKEKFEEIVSFIRNLDPMPGRNYSSQQPTYVIPDVMVREKDGEFVIILNDEEIPVLGINSFFTTLIKDKKNNPEPKTKKFVTTNVKDARWFIRSINQRNETLLKITRAVVEFQRDFFLKGPKYLVPLTLKDIADEVGVHETTVSRIANAKYIQTEWGIFELRYFFSNSITGAGSSGSRYSKEGVKAIIKEIIEENSSGKRLSDQKIADSLQQRGIKLARRTVAKYRNELDIMSSYDR
jgi:RNA polymerase sigma-54 factor